MQTLVKTCPRYRSWSSDWLRLRSRRDGHGHHVVKPSLRCQPRNNNLLFQQRGREGTGRGAEKGRTANPEEDPSFALFPDPQNSQCKKTLSGERMLGSSNRTCARMPIAHASTYVSDAAKQVRSTIPAAASRQKSELPPHF